jgi:hypothetical protein
VSPNDKVTAARTVARRLCCRISLRTFSNWQQVSPF